MRVVIHRPAKTATQSGQAGGRDWLLTPEPLGPRAPEPLMGWLAADDTLGELRGRLRFPTQVQALAFARARGWECVCAAPHERRVRPKSYLDNFRRPPPDEEESASTP